LFQLMDINHQRQVFLIAAVVFVPVRLGFQTEKVLFFVPYCV